MALQVCFREDIAHVLSGLVLATIETHLANGSSNAEHLDGALAMARGLAMAFGVRWPSVLGQVRGALGGDVSGLLDEAAVLLEAGYTY